MCRVDVSDIMGCSMGKVETAVSVEAVGGAALDGVEGEASVTHCKAPKVSTGSLHARQASHDFKDFDRRVRGREKGGAVVLRPVVGHMAARLHVGVATDRRVHVEVPTNTAPDVIGEHVLGQGERVVVVHVVHQGEERAGLEGPVRLVAQRTQ
jgi:hypothetical protein